MSLPEIGRDWAAAILISSGALLLLKRLGHRGLYFVLPGGWVEVGESPEDACVTRATDELRAAAKELSDQIGIDLHEEHLGLSMRRKVASHPWIAGTYNYFLVGGNGHALLTGPQFTPQLDQKLVGVWHPYEWVSLDRLPGNLEPREAIAICRRLEELR